MSLYSTPCIYLSVFLSWRQQFALCALFSLLFFSHGFKNNFWFFSLFIFLLTARREWWLLNLLSVELETRISLFNFIIDGLLINVGLWCSKDLTWIIWKQMYNIDPKIFKSISGCLTGWRPTKFNGGRRRDVHNLFWVVKSYVSIHGKWGHTCGYGSSNSKGIHCEETH